MGRRMLRTGDFVTANASVNGGLVLWNYPESAKAGDRWIVGKLTVGMLITTMMVMKATARSKYKPQLVAYAFILDSALMQLGWCQASYLKRVE